MSGGQQAIIQATPMRCMNCSHEWRENLIGNVVVDVWVAHVRSLRCPACGVGSDKLAMVFRPAAGNGEI